MAKKKNVIDMNLFYSAKDALAAEKNRTILSVSPSIDIRMGGGILEGSFVLIQGKPKCGKMQPVDSIVYTPTGGTPMSELKTGQDICTETGTVCQITNIFEHKNKDVYKITFSDGSSTECGLEHLWEVTTNSYPYNKTEVISTEEMIKTGLYMSDRYRYMIKITEPVHFKENKINIHPYILGCILGDGCISQDRIDLTSADPEIVNRCNSFLENGFEFKQSKTDKILYRLNSNNKINKYRLYLEELGLMGLTSHTKFIPEIYLLNSVENRIHLLNGLMDTDGGVCLKSNGSTTIEYSTTSEKLAKNVKWLVQSLGGLVKIKERYTSYDKEKYFKSYRLHIRFNDGSIAFSLARKKNLVKIRTKNNLTKKIISIEKSRTVDCRCLEVNNPTRLYLTDEFIVTHNTLTCMEITVNALKQGRWVIYFDTENRMTASKYFEIEGFDILNHPKFLLMNSESSKDGKITSGDKMYGTIIQMMKSPKFKGAVFIIDSLSDVITQDVLDDPEVTSQRRDSTPKLNADFCKKVGPYIRRANAILIGVQHLQQDISPTGHGALKPVGGDRLAYRCDYVLLSKHSPLNFEGKTINGGFSKGEDAVEGLLIRYDLTANKLLGPYVAKEGDEKIQNYYNFGKGCWWEKEALEVFKEIGLIMQGGAYYTFFTEKFSERIQGTQKTLNILLENKEYFNSVLRNYYSETYGVNYNFQQAECVEEEVE